MIRPLRCYDSRGIKTISLISNTLKIFHVIVSSARIDRVIETHDRQSCGIVCGIQNRRQLADRIPNWSRPSSRDLRLRIFAESNRLVVTVKLVWLFISVIGSDAFRTVGTYSMFF